MYDLGPYKVHINGVKVDSGVPNQPMNDEDMIKGAENRARNAADRLPTAKYSIGMEAGARNLPGGWFNLGWVCVLDVVSGQTGFGATAAHEIPVPVRDLMEFEGLELSDAVTRIYNTDTVNDRDCPGVITNGLMPADRLYASGIVCAFAAMENNLRNNSSS